MSHKKVEIYTTPTCPYCTVAKALLRRKGVTYTEISAEEEEVRIHMTQRAGGMRTVPQIFVDGVLVPGGSDGLRELESKGQLSRILGLQD